MHKLFALISLLVITASAHAGFDIMTDEDKVMAVLISAELQTAKQSDSRFEGLLLKNISVEEYQVIITYSYDEMTCIVRAVVVGSDTIPDGAAGVNIAAKVKSVNSICAQEAK